MGEFETVQPFVFLSADNLRNIRLSCDGPLLNKFDLAPWTEDIELQNDDIIDNNNEHFDDNDLQNRDIKDFFDFGDFRSRRDVWEARKRKRVTTQKPNAPKRRYTTTDRTDLKIPITNVTVHTVPFEKHYGYYDETPAPQFQQYQRYTTRKYYPIRDKNDYTYLFAKVSSTTPIPRTTPSRRSQTPLEVNIKIQYYPPTSSPPKRKQPIVYARPQNSNGYGNGYSNKPQTNYRPQQSYNDELYLVQKPYRRPNTNQGYSFSGETFVLKPMPMQNEPVAIDDSEHDQNYDLLDEQEDFLPTKPLVNVKLTDDQTYNSDKHHTLEYNDKQHAWQVYQNYDDAEPEIDRVFNTKQTDREQVSNKRKFTEEKPPGHPYSIAYIEKLSSHNKNDKLDFRTRLVYKRKFNKPTTDDDDGYVSSAKSDDETEEYDDDYDRQEKASYREGSTFIDDARVDKMEYERIRLVDIDVLLNKEGHIRWKPYNKSETQMADDLKMPELDQNVRSSDEIPKRINSVNYNE
ncbi:hypothetical protein HHI36_015241 [Cryptolaemus montrouzieri]|uniref:Uncharacterized protein n=1 Tax=Cryptolaemus montrouzieri TaxID=559131 RepID=A0ABD2N551_9CUCU